VAAIDVFVLKHGEQPLGSLCDTAERDAVDQMVAPRELMPAPQTELGGGGREEENYENKRDTCSQRA
jgi:hypothetical protein